MISEKDQELMKKVAAFFRSTIDPEIMPEGSIRETALKFDMTRTKVQKILVTMGEYSNAQTREIQKLRGEGKSVKEIAKELGVSEATVSASLPYTTVFHGTSTPSDHTQAVRNYRAYEKKRQNMKKEKIEEFSFTPEETSFPGNKTPLSESANTPSEETGDKGIPLPDGMMLVLCAPADKNPERDELCGSLIRAMIVPDDMPLVSLHYALQRAYGFHDRYYHNFMLFEEDGDRLTHSQLGNWMDMCGDTFSQTDYGDFYEKGSEKMWMRKQYTYPYPHVDFEPEERHPESLYSMYVRDTRIKDGTVRDWTILQAAHTWGGEGEYVKINRELTKYPHVFFTYCTADDPDACKRELIPARKAHIGFFDWFTAREPYRLNESIKIKDLPSDELLYNYAADYTIYVGFNRKIDLGLSEAKLKKCTDKVREKKCPVLVFRDGTMYYDNFPTQAGFIDFMKNLTDETEKEARANGWYKDFVEDDYYLL